MHTVQITMTDRHYQEFSALAASRGETKAQVLKAALALYAHASDAIHAGRQVLVANSKGTPLKQLTLPGVTRAPWWRRVVSARAKRIGTLSRSSYLFLPYLCRPLAPRR